MFARMLAAFVSVSALFGPPAKAEIAETALALPAMGPCTDSTHPLLPKRWHGTYLMAPFTRAQLTLGDFVYDGSLPAMRVRLYGLRQGAADLLIKGARTYLLSSGAGPSAECLDLGDTGLRPLPSDLLAANARCEGSAPVHGTPVIWWKTPSTPRPSANWIWYKTADRSPFRFMFTQPAMEYGVLGLYTFSYQVSFETLSDSSLPALAAKCGPGSRRAEISGRAALGRVIADMEAASSRHDAEISRLMPDLGACPNMRAPVWPEKASITALMTASDFESRPAPAEVLYDWDRQSLRTRMFFPGNSELASEDALLAGNNGYGVVRLAKGHPICTAGLPGPPRPDWPESGGCSCEAAIKGKTALTPIGPARIMVCPMTAPRVVWSWFSFDDRPIVFMETSAPGDDPSAVLAVADYYDWKPGYLPAYANFEAPAQCPAPKMKAGPQKSSKHGMQPDRRRCGACHLENPSAQ
jgi:hypothetical protein